MTGPAAEGAAAADDEAGGDAAGIDEAGGDAGAVALVTGASGVLGGAVAAELWRRGYRTAVHGRNRKRLATVLREAPEPHRRALPLLADLTSPAAAPAMARTLTERWGRLDLLVHCAAVFPARPLTEGPEEEWAAHWEEVLAANLTATARLVRALVPPLRAAERPTVLLVGSEPVTRPAARPDREAYYASKGGAVGLARGLTASLADDGVHTLVVHPGWIVPDRAFSDPERQLPAGELGRAVVDLAEVAARVGLRDTVLVPRPVRRPAP